MQRVETVLSGRVASGATFRPAHSARATARVRSGTIVITGSGATARVRCTARVCSSAIARACSGAAVRTRPDATVRARSGAKYRIITDAIGFVIYIVAGASGKGAQEHGSRAKLPVTNCKQ